MTPYYVWRDTFLEELFILEKKELEKDYPNLKKQLESEGVKFYLFETDTKEEALTAYKDKYGEVKNFNYNKPTSNFLN